MIYPLKMVDLSIVYPCISDPTEFHVPNVAVIPFLWAASSDPGEKSASSTPSTAAPEESLPWLRLTMGESVLKWIHVSV